MCPTSHTLLSSYTDWPIIIGGGVAGLSTALKLKRPCLLIAPSFSGDTTSSMLAQGGMSAAILPHDSPEQHAKDTLKAGSGLCDPTIVRAITQSGAHAVETLLHYGVPLTRCKNGQLDAHLEAAHTHPRVIYAGGDQTGAAITQTLLQRAQESPHIHFLHTSLIGLATHNNELLGVHTSHGFIATRHCVLASGGCGGLYSHTTNPLSNRGAVLGMAAYAGASLSDMEFTQFHPTALNVGTSSKRLPLISEAVRGAGAHLILENGKTFTDELAPRDVVSRAISAQIHQGHHVFIDGRHLEKPFSHLFPGITALCRKANINPNTTPIPVQPAMHYHMGGITVDKKGRSSISGLWACGEIACTGLHGANRLASNSLLEALITGEWVAEDINNTPLIPSKQKLPSPTYPLSSHEWPLRHEMQRHVGILRTKKGLTSFLEDALPLARTNPCALTASFIAWAALNRPEQRGGHWRKDTASPLPPKRHTWRIHDLPL